MTSAIGGSEFPRAEKRPLQPSAAVCARESRRERFYFSAQRRVEVEMLSRSSWFSDLFRKSEYLGLRL